MTKQRAQKDILYITVSSFILVIAWIAFNIHHALTTTTISEDLQVQIEPISPDFDMQTIQNLKTRTQVAPINQVSNPVVTGQPEATVTPLASESADIEQSQETVIIP